MQSVLSIGLVTFLFPFISLAAVWDSPNYWDQSWEAKYVEWMKTEVSRDIFKNPASKWNGTKTDCADAAYAMRIIFSYENGLPFQMKNPSGSRPEEGEQAKFLNNDVDAFDKYEAGVKRVIRFIEYIGDSVGTEHLAYHDTYSTTVQNINAGHIYIYQYGGGTRHTYIVKDRLIDGNLVLYWSTVPKAPRKLARKRGMPGGFTGRPWGFKRFKQPHFYDDAFIYGEETFSSKEQYEILKKVGKKKVNKTFKNMLRLEEENLADGLKRYVENACDALKDRLEVINITQDYLTKKGGRCLSKQEYYDYSTPGRDSKIVETLNLLIEGWETVVETGRSNEVPKDLSKALDFLTGKERRGEKELNKFCQISFEVKGSTYKLNLKDFYKRYNKKSFFGRRALSPHPNDPVLLRWGLKAKKSKCDKY